MKAPMKDLTNNTNLQTNPASDSNGKGKSADPDSDKVKREEEDDNLLPDEEEDDFDETYGDLDGGQDDLSLPAPEKGAENLE